jgi:N-methylhydantoinase A/oxoprolinase/acetone carboxylase beta subunit
MTGEIKPWAVHERGGMTIGASVKGPAIICEDETSTLVSPGWRGFMNGLGYIEIVREEA